MHWSCKRNTSTQNDCHQTRYFNVNFDSNGLLFVFFAISEKFLQFRKQQKYLLTKIFGSLDKSNRIYLMRNSFSNYVYLKDMYITLKEIEKILFVSVLRIFLICRFLDFTNVFTKKELSFQNFAYNFLCENVNINLIHPFSYYHLSPLKNTTKLVGFACYEYKLHLRNSKKFYWIILFFFVFTLVFFQELETREK